MTPLANYQKNHPATSKGRAISLVAKAFLGLVYLTRTGATYGIEGPGLGTTEYSEAVTLFNEVINSGKFSWVINYANIFSYTNEGNGDIVFDIQAIGGNTGDVGVGADFHQKYMTERMALLLDWVFREVRILIVPRPHLKISKNRTKQVISVILFDSAQLCQFIGEHCKHRANHEILRCFEKRS